MSTKTQIQWADSTVNPVMACQGCELWPTANQVINSLIDATELSDPGDLNRIRSALQGKSPTRIYHERKAIAHDLSAIFNQHPKGAKLLEKAIATNFRCYAGVLHLRHGSDHTQPNKITNAGYAPSFETPTQFPGRMLKAAGLSDLSGKDRPEKPWLNGFPRLIFVSDMADALSATISFEFLQKEIIEVVNTPAGMRHVWLWLSKRPSRMASFSRWLSAQGCTWPDHLVAMTSVTSQKTVGRILELQKVECKIKGVSIEPLWSEVSLPLAGISWGIVGGESGPYAHPFHLEWARSVVAQCRDFGTEPFVKQLGSKPFCTDASLGINGLRHISPNCW